VGIRLHTNKNFAACEFHIHEIDGFEVVSILYFCLSLSTIRKDRNTI